MSAPRMSRTCVCAAPKAGALASSGSRPASNHLDPKLICEKISTRLWNVRRKMRRKGPTRKPISVRKAPDEQNQTEARLTLDHVFVPYEFFVARATKDRSHGSRGFFLRKSSAIDCCSRSLIAN